MKAQEELSLPLDDFEYEELESFLLSLESETALLNMSEFDGFITAIVSGPENVPPREWLPLVWGGDAGAAGLGEPGELERIGRLMMRHVNTTAMTMMDDPESFEPWFMEKEVDGRVYLVVDDWCIGYMRGVLLRRDQWEKDGTDIVELLSPIPLFTSDEGWSLLDQLGDRHVEYLQKQVAGTALDAHAYWRGRRQTFRMPEGVRLH